MEFHREEVRREQEAQREKGREGDKLEHLPLNDAAAMGDLRLVQQLVYKDPSTINLKDRNGWQPIHEGMKRGS